MKHRPTTELLDELATRSRQNIAQLQELSRLPEKSLHLRPRPDAWTALEALQHLNSFNKDYHRLLRTAIETGKTTSPTDTFTSGWLGNLIANWARPGAKTIKLPTLKKMNPRKQALDRSVLDRCLQNEQRLAEMIDDARGVDLTNTKISTAEVAFVKLRVGDALRMLVNHDWRHIEQAERATRGEAGIRTTKI